MDFGREKEVFPLVLIQVKSAAKRTVFDLKNKREKTFLPFKTQLFHIQVVRYAVWESSTTCRSPTGCTRQSRITRPVDRLDIFICFLSVAAFSMYSLIFSIILSPVCSRNGYEGQNSVPHTIQQGQVNEFHEIPLKPIQITVNIRFVFQPV